MDQNKRIYGCISTFEELTTKGDIILDCAMEFIEKVVRPLGKESELQIGYQGSEVRTKSLKCNEANIKKVRDLFNDGKIHSMNVYYYDFDKNYTTLSFYYCSNASNTVYASIVDFSIEDFYYDIIPDYVQESCVEIIMKLSSNIDSVGGFITHDHLAIITANSPHEIYAGRAYPWASREFDKYYRGYQWGNFLSKKHVEILGGIERVMIDAPVYKSIRLDDGGVFLQLTKDINIYTNEDLKKLKKFLRPILPSPISKTSFEQYQNLRIVVDEDDFDVAESNVIPNNIIEQKINPNLYDDFDYSNYEKLFEMPISVEINEDVFFNDMEIIYYITENLGSVQERAIKSKVEERVEKNINDNRRESILTYARNIVYDKDEKVISIRVGMGLNSISGFIELVKFIYDTICDYTNVSKINII